MTLTLPEMPQGLHLDVPEAIYHTKHLGLVRKTALDQVLVAPATYYAWVTGQLEDETSKALAFGTALHCATLEPQVFKAIYAVEPDFGDCRANKKTGTTKEEGAANSARRDTWRASHRGFIFLSHDDHQTILGMAAALHRHPKASKLLAWPSGVSEVTVRWDIGVPGLPAAARIDRLIPDLDTALDLKGMADASEDAWSRAIESYGYFRQGPLYCDGLEAVGRPVDDFVFLVVEKTPPYLIGLYKLDEKDVEAGRAQNYELMHKMHECLMSGVWPGLDENIVTVRRPRWARNA